MPQYSFFNQETNEYRDVFFHMNDLKDYKGENGLEEGKWRRVYTVPQASIDTRIDPRDKTSFVRRTEKYKTLGSMQDISREMSEKRAEKDGIDHVKQAYFKDYESTRGGKKHPDSIPKIIDTPAMTIDFN